MDRRIYDGFPELGTLKVEWNVKNNGEEIHLRITGFEKDELDADSEQLFRQNMSIGFHSKIILTKKAH